MRKIPIFLIACLLLTLLVYTPIPVSAAPWTPSEWQQDQGKMTDWIRDRNGNFVDDLIESKSSDTRKVDIIVDLNQCIRNRNNSALIDFLGSIGDVDYIGKYVTFITVNGVDVERIFDIANRPEVAMVELAIPTRWSHDSFSAAKIKGGFYSPNTLQDDVRLPNRWPGALNGAGVNIAFIDSGVGPQYDNSFRHGFDFTIDDPGVSNPQDRNPPPDLSNDHATAMADFVFASDGVTPQAGLIDIKMRQGVNNAFIAKVMDRVIDRHREWNINVVSMPFASTFASDGRDALSQTINLLSAKGVVVVTSAGDNSGGAPVSSPGAASLSLTAGAADMFGVPGTVDRTDDITPFVTGPRANDQDQDLLDELKPEITFPTGEDACCLSNSHATAETAGLAALILQQNPDLRNLDNVGSGSVKDLLVRSAEVKGVPDPGVAVNYPHPSPTWARSWGFGEIDAYNAFAHLTGISPDGKTDLTFVGFDGSPHPNSPFWFSRAIETQSERDGRNIAVGTPDRIFVKIHNNGPTDARNIKVTFSFYPFTVGSPQQLKFHDIGSKIIDTIPSGQDRVEFIDWTPPPLSAGHEHGCLYVSIDYGYDSSFSGMSNVAQKNVQVALASSPAEFDFRVENPLPSLAKIDLTVNKSGYQNWNVTLSGTGFLMAPEDCSRTVHATVVPPADAKPGTEAIFFIGANATESHKPSFNIGGVALKIRVS
jgi:Subtilase family